MIALIIVGTLLLVGTLIADNIKVPTHTVGDGYEPGEQRQLSYKELRKERRNEVRGRR